jgi:hypothetical protein
MPYSVLMPIFADRIFVYDAIGRYKRILAVDGSGSFRGRVMAVHTTIFMGMAPFGSLLAGFQHSGCSGTQEAMPSPQCVSNGFGELHERGASSCFFSAIAND